MDDIFKPTKFNVIEFENGERFIISYFRLYQALRKHYSLSVHELSIDITDKDKSRINSSESKSVSTKL